MQQSVPVVFANQCDADGNCPRCRIDYAECECVGPTQDGYEYTTKGGTLFARQLKLFTPDAIRSVYDSQAAILGAIRTLHCPDGFECDLTYGHGAFWKGMEPPLHRFDITPMVAGVQQACSTAVPLFDASLGSIVFDPPFLTYVKGGRGHQSGGVAMTKRFGGYYRYEELEKHYRGTVIECRRLLRSRGRLVFKCQDIIHNHRMHCTHAKVIAMAESNGFRLLDLFILTSKSRMPGPQKGQQRHARVWHSYFLVFERLAT